MINVMHVIDSLDVGGAERMLVSQVNAGDRDRFRVSVCVTRSGLSLAREIDQNIPVMELKRKWSLEIRGFEKIRAFAKQQNVKIFHAHGRSTYQFLVIASMLGYIKGQIIFHDHFGNIEKDQFVPVWFRLLGRHRLAAYVGVCKKLSDWALKAGVAEDRVFTIGNTLDFDRFQNEEPKDLHQELGVPLEKNIGVLVGNVRPAKGLDLLIDAYKEAGFHSPPVIVVLGKIVDHDYYRHCQEMLLTAGIEDSFKFVGLQINSIPWMKGADFGVMSSRSESGPLVIIEMMGCELPFVAFNVGNVSSIASDVFPDCFVSPENTEAFVDILQETANSSKWDLAERGRNLSEKAKELFDIQSKMAQWYSLYSNIASRES